MWAADPQVSFQTISPKTFSLSKLKVNHTTSDETMNVGVSKKGKLRPGSLNLVRILKLT